MEPVKRNNQSVFGIYQLRSEVDYAVVNLKQAGFRHSDISVLMPEGGNPRAIGHEKETKAPEGTATGVAAGAFIGGSLGWLVGIGALAIPGVGPFIAAGPIMGALAGLGVGGAVGGFTGALIGLGVPEYEAKRYEESIRSGGILLSVHTDDSEWAKRAREILERTGATDIASAAEVKKSDHDKFDNSRKPAVPFYENKNPTIL